MAEGCELDATHAFWLGRAFVSPRLRQLCLPDGRAEVVSLAVMRLLVALHLRAEGVSRAALAQGCAIGRVSGVDRALRRLDRLASGIGRGQFRLAFEGDRVRLIALPERILSLGEPRVAAPVGGVRALARA